MAKAKAQKIVRPDEPNVIIPLATSINERGVAGYTHSVTNSEDQRKLNCFYEISKNPMTGKGTLTLTKRPGVTIDETSAGSSGQLAYLVLAPLNETQFAAVFYTSGTDAKSSTNSGVTNTILAGASYIPTFVDVTAISNAQTIVVQLTLPTNINTAHRVFYITKTSLLAAGAWTEIVDADFTGYIHRGKMEHLDGYALNLTNTNLIINSDINSVANWTANGFLAKQIRQDTPIGLARLSNQILAFGGETVEVFFNNGNTIGSPLGRLPHLHEKIGMVQFFSTSGATHYYATLENRIYFIGKRSGGAIFSKSLGVFAYDGTRFERVSTPYIDKIISEEFGSLYSVTAVGFLGQTAVAICLTAPGVATQRWLMFFPDWKEWFEWTSTVFSPVNSGDYFLGVGSNRHKLYYFSGADSWQDNAVSYPWSTQFRLPTNGSARRFMHMYGVDADTDASANDLTVEISTNDCASFSTLGTIDQTQDRKLSFRGGAFRKAHIRLGNTNARPTRIHNFLARID